MESKAIRASFYLVRQSYRYPFVQKGDYVVKLPNNKCFKLQHFTQAQGTFDVDDRFNLDMTKFSHIYIENRPTSHQKLIELSE